MSSAFARSPIGRFLELPAGDRRLFLAAWMRLLGADLRLRMDPRRALSKAIEGASRGGGARDIDRSSELAARLALAVARAAAHHLQPMTCLPRALALSAMLVARGIPCAVRIGVRKESGAVAAHAWVEIDGRPLGEPLDVEPRFLPLVLAVAPNERS